MVEPKHEGKTAVMFATGPSLTSEVIELVRPYHESGKVLAIGCNDSYKVINYLDILYACDATWWDYHIEHNDVLDICKAELWTQEEKIVKKYENINHIPGIHSPAFSIEPNLIHFGSNSGYQQLNLAYLMGVRKFILCGYNMGAGGSTHFFGVHPKGLNRSSPYNIFIQAYNSIQPEIKEMVINCTEPTALECFKKQTLKETLEEL